MEQFSCRILKRIRPGWLRWRIGRVLAQDSSTKYRVKKWYEYIQSKNKKNWMAIKKKREKNKHKEMQVN